MLGKVAPYGVYDVGANTGWVNVGTDADTGAFAVESIRRWWAKIGHPCYPQAKRLLITADGGGSNGARLRLWKTELGQLDAETGLRIQAMLDTNIYEKGIKITDQQIKAFEVAHLQRHDFHGDCDYTVRAATGANATCPNQPN